MGRNQSVCRTMTILLFQRLIEVRERHRADLPEAWMRGIRRVGEIGFEVGDEADPNALVGHSLPRKREGRAEAPLFD